MAFQVVKEQRPGRNSGTVDIFVLRGSAGFPRAEICPALGCNCFRWQIQAGSGPVDLIRSEADFLDGQHPTRSGYPLLFPFPNRIRAGRFNWNGRSFTLPCNDAPGKNAIHGFVCRRAWDVTSTKATDNEAYVEATFQGSLQAPETLPLWPADYRIVAKWSLRPTSLQLDVAVQNVDHSDLPFGFGAHPYFRLPVDGTIQVFARKYWELQEMLPTGKLLPVTSRWDLNQPRRFVDVQLDDVLTDIPEIRDDANGHQELNLLGRWESPGLSLRMGASRSFRHSVVFTPAHRQAFCLEPYTCTTDAINLQQGGVEAGLMVLRPGERWDASILVEVAAK